MSNLKRESGTDPLKDNASLFPMMEEAKPEKSCCGPGSIASLETVAPAEAPWSDGSVSSSVGDIVRVKTRLSARDRIGTFIVRWGMNRMSYALRPGLYAIGQPEADSAVFVTANYKMSFDRLRSNLDGRNGWLLVLDTKGVNVWCAAGKGTFGTAELISRVSQTRLSEVVSHRRLILPQLGAPGVAAHEVKEATGFKVKYGPIRAEDLPAFIDQRNVATKEMRRVRFGLTERIVLIPVELVGSPKTVSGLALIFFALGAALSFDYTLGPMVWSGLRGALLFMAGLMGGAVLMPILLPWLPGRSFSAKGALAGLLMAGLIGIYLWQSAGSWPPLSLTTAGWALLIATIASFVGMNFTGSSTYTSLSGVEKEMHLAVRLQAGATLSGLILLISQRLL